ncbi:MAG: TetR/AcrR family transcriptional regulator [Erysipelotrichaceae bacterium]|nr:TetR/AcrR family transcriptional regulator [Erysipelotrichaceae bacterium]
MTKQEQYDKTHLKIFKQAYQLFQEKSYEQVTIRDICRKCDLSIGAFYHHYSSKEAIISEGYKQFDQMLEEILKNKTFSSSKEEILYLLELEISTTEKEGWQFTLTYFKNQMDAKEKYILDENLNLKQI